MEKINWEALGKALLRHDGTVVLQHGNVRVVANREVLERRIAALQQEEAVSQLQS